jgi:starvation-inducible outer membrane lipoprotein
MKKKWLWFGLALILSSCLTLPSPMIRRERTGITIHNSAFQQVITEVIVFDADHRRTADGYLNLSGRERFGGIGFNLDAGLYDITLTISKRPLVGVGWRFSRYNLPHVLIADGQRIRFRWNGKVLLYER